MTFKHFEEIVKNKYPNAKMWAHGQMAGNKINVSIVFNLSSDGTGKVYSYNGTYVNVLNKLHINAIYKHDVEAKEKLLNRLKEEHGTWESNPFLPNEPPELIDNTDKISELENELRDIYNNYEIV